VGGEGEGKRRKRAERGKMQWVRGGKGMKAEHTSLPFFLSLFSGIIFFSFLSIF
jgi:hypothetical protein